MNGTLISAEIAWCEALVGAVKTAPDRTSDDAQIIEEFLGSGGDEFFALLVQRYKDRVYRLVVSILGPAGDAEAEDLLQEIFITVYRKLDTFRGDCRFSTWLYRLARNRAIDCRRRPRPFADVDDDQSLEGVVSPTAMDPFAELDHSGRVSRILRRVDRLGEPRRTVVFLFYWMGCDVEEISGLTEIPVGTVKSHLYRARRELAGELAGEATCG